MIIIIIIIITTIITIRNEKVVYSSGIRQNRRQAGHQFSTVTLPGIALYCRWAEVFGNSHAI